MKFESNLVIIGICVIVMGLKASSSVIKRSSPQCSSSKLCNYGGKCHYGHCACRFDCSLKYWPGKYYCGPKQSGNRRRQYYSNLCQVLAHACTLQEDIPVVEFNLERMQCEDDIRPRHKLCSNPKDHMGSCGGSKGSYGSVKAGVCLVETYSSQQLCKCPNDKTGVDCSLNIPSFSGIKYSVRPEEGDELRYSVKLVAISVTATLMFVFSVYAVVKSCKARRQRSLDRQSERDRLSASSEKDLNQSDFDKQTRVKDKKSPPRLFSEISQYSSKSSEVVAFERDAQRRGRLRGESFSVVPVVQRAPCPCRNTTDVKNSSSNCVYVVKNNNNLNVKIDKD